MKLTDDIIKKIKEITKHELNEHNITNEIVRDDVFSILDSHCIILYYPLEDENINGYHISRRINDKINDFVFINTANTTEKQVFAAAHELGHILKVDKDIIKEFKLKTDSALSETIINRFAAELLMPQEIFEKKSNQILKALGVKGNKIHIDKMLKLIVYLMNEFLVEFEAIVRRFYELGKINDDAVSLLLALKNDSYFQEEIISIAKAANFTRLFIKSHNKSMSELKKYADEATEKQSLTEEKIEKILKCFDIKPISSKGDNDSIDLL